MSNCVSCDRKAKFIAVQCCLVAAADLEKAVADSQAFSYRVGSVPRLLDIKCNHFCPTIAYTQPTTAHDRARNWTDIKLAIIICCFKLVLLLV